MNTRNVTVIGPDAEMCVPSCASWQNASCAKRLAAGELAYLAPSRVNLQLTQERWPGIEFHATREQA